MKVAFVAEYPVTGDRVVGGVQTVVQRLASAMARRPGFEVHVVSYELGRTHPAEEEMDGVRVHRFPQQRRLGNVTFARNERRGTARALRRIHPDIAHAQLLGAASLGTAESGVPWVASAHGVLREEGRLLEGGFGRVRAWARATMEEMSLRRLRHLIVTSPYVQEAFGRSLEGIVTHAIENPVDEEFFRIPSGGDPRVVLVPARLIPRKDPLTLLEAAAILARRGERFSIRFTGSDEAPEFFHALQTRVRDLDLGNHVQFLGSIPRARLLREFEEAGLVALSSREETSPLAVMEAMAAGRAVVATDVGERGISSNRERAAGWFPRETRKHWPAPWEKGSAMGHVPGASERGAGRSREADSSWRRWWIVRSPSTKRFSPSHRRGQHEKSVEDICRSG